MCAPIRRAISFLFLVLLRAPGAFGAWSSDPATDHIVVDRVGGQTKASVVADGLGGAFVAWQDTRLGSSVLQIYVQHIGTGGAMSWADDGVLAGYGGEDQNDPCAALDGAGGVIVAWEDARGDGTSIYAQRFDANGNKLWGNDGLLICDVLRDQGPPRIISDGVGGAFMAWDDRRRFQQEDIYGQRVGPDGSRLWATDGFAIQAGSGAERSVELVPDGAGGVVAIATDLSNDVIRAIRLTATANPVWGPLPISTGAQNFPEIHAVADGSGGAIVVWRSTFNDLLGQHVDGSGALLWNGALDQAISPIVGSKTHHRVSADGAGGSYVTWTDWRNGSAEVFAQHLDPSGARLWTDAGTLVDNANINAPNPNVTDDGSGNAIVTWIAHENGATEIQAQKFSPGGTAAWAADGVEVSLGSAGTNMLVEVVRAGDGGAITVFERNSGAGTSLDLFAKKVTGIGSLGGAVGVGDPPPPHRVSITAYPNPFSAGVRVEIEPAIQPGERIEITNAAGRHVRSLAVSASGALEWDGSNTAGRPVAAGIYYVRIPHTQGGAVRLVRVR